MKNEILLQFYFGSITEADRLETERRLLDDPETLLDYLDLKRELEAAIPVPQKPSAALWQRLKPQAPTRRIWTLGLAASLAAAVVFAIVFSRRPPAEDIPNHSIQRTLFDSGHEQFGVSNVL